VLNDIGPALDHAALERIGAYTSQQVMFDTQEEAERYIRDIAAPFGPHTELQWKKLANDVLRQDAEGKWIRHYDPQLAAPFRNSTVETTAQAEKMMWAAYDAIRCPTLLVRGAQSDLLGIDTANEMTQRGPKATLVQFEGVGHAPTLMHGDQIAAVQKFLLA
jgi:pimeloyl-ACP methyl ester carboxylesterase